VFFIPNGLIGLLQAWRSRLGTRDLSQRLHALADRIGDRAPGSAAVSGSPIKQDGLGHGSPPPPTRPDRTRQP